jgi:hypothetical protein
MVIVDVQDITVPHISYFSSNVLFLYTIFILQSVHVFKLHTNLKTCGKLFLCHFFVMIFGRRSTAGLFGSYPLYYSLFCSFKGTYCLPLLNFAQMYSAELGSGGCFSIVNIINSR